MTHKSGHTTDPNYDKLPWRTKMRYDNMVEGVKGGKGVNSANDDDSDTLRRAREK